MTTATHETRAHSPFGASGMALLMACPGAYRMQQKAPPDPGPNLAADEGTAAHQLAEFCLSVAVDKQSPDWIDSADNYIGTVITVKGTRFPVDHDMANAVQVYLDTIQADWKEHGGTLCVEQRFDLSSVVRPNMFGSNDAMLHGCRDGVLRVYDYKHGRGVIVEGVGNVQLRYYALGAMAAMDLRGVREVETIIVQPRGKTE